MILAIRAFRATIFAFNAAIEVWIAAEASVTVVDAVKVVLPMAVSNPDATSRTTENGPAESGA